MVPLNQAPESERPQSDHSRRRRRWFGIVSGVVVVLAVMAGLATAVFQYGLPWWMDEGDRNHVYASDGGSQRYQVHLPPQYDGSTHNCTNCTNCGLVLDSSELIDAAELEPSL